MKASLRWDLIEVALHGVAENASLTDDVSRLELRRNGRWWFVGPVILSCRRFGQVIRLENARCEKISSVAARVEEKDDGIGHEEERRVTNRKLIFPLNSNARTNEMLRSVESVLTSLCSLTRRRICSSLLHRITNHDKSTCQKCHNEK